MALNTRNIFAGILIIMIVIGCKKSSKTPLPSDGNGRSRTINSHNPLVGTWIFKSQESSTKDLGNFDYQHFTYAIGKDTTNYTDYCRQRFDSLIIKQDGSFYGYFIDNMYPLAICGKCFSSDSLLNFDSVKIVNLFINSSNPTPSIYWFFYEKDGKNLTLRTPYIIGVTFDCGEPDVNLQKDDISYIKVRE